jgi:hypothetical protein
MKMKTLITVAALAVVPFAYSDDLELTLWKGETFSCVIDDDVKVGKAPAGFEFKTGVAEKVKYLPHSTQMKAKRAKKRGRIDISKLPRKEKSDRVVWGGKGPGVRVFSVTADANVKPGVYTAGDVKITVLDRTLPPASQWKYYLDLWQHPWAVARYYNVKPFSKEHYAKMRPLWEMLANAGNKALTVTIVNLAWNHQCYDGYGTMIKRIKKADGTWKFDFSLFDEYVEFGRSCGLGPDITCYTMCPWGYKVYWEDETGKSHSAKAVPGTPFFKDYWGQFLVEFSKHLKSKGWFENTYIAMDERSPKDVRNIANFITEKAPGLKVALAGNRAPSQFVGIKLDYCCFGLGHLTDKLVSEAPPRKKNGMITTYYVCCGPARPNTMSDNKLEESFWLGAYPAFVGLDGFLRWAWNSWPRDPNNDMTFPGNGDGWPSGDTYLVYPDAVPSLRFLELRNGIVAAEKVWILKEKGLFAKEIAELAKRYSRSDALKGKTDFDDLREDTLELVNKK